MQGFFRGSDLQKSSKDEFRRGAPKCGLCQFFKTCSTPRMAPGGKNQTGVLVVGEHPGKSDDRLGEHFRGPGGRRFRDSLRAIGQKLGDSALTHAMICRPNKGGFSDKNISACRPALLRAVDEKKPKVILLLGSAAVRSLIPTERGGSVGRMERWVGWAIPSKQLNAWLCPAWSPQHVLRMREDPAILKIWEDHLRRAFELTEVEPRGYSMDELWQRVEVVRSPRNARQRLADLAKKEGRLAFDYETNCVKPELPKAQLVSASFCLEGADTFAFMVRDEETLRAMSPVLRSKRLKKIGSNIKFEERWTRRLLGHVVEGWYHDTMLAAHVVDNRSNVTSVKFQAYVYLGVPDYDRFVEPFIKPRKGGYNRILEMDELDLLRYNGLDSLLEYEVAGRQRKELGLPW